MAHDSFSLPVTILLGKKVSPGNHVECALNSVSERNYAREAFASASRSFSFALEIVTIDRVAEERSIMSMDHPLEHKPVFYFSASLKLYSNRGEIALPITMDAFVRECMDAKAQGKIPDFSHDAIRQMAMLPKNESADNGVALARYHHGIEFANGGQNAKQAAPVFSRQWWTDKFRLG